MSKENHSSFPIDHGSSEIIIYNNSGLQGEMLDVPSGYLSEGRTILALGNRAEELLKKNNINSIISGGIRHPYSIDQYYKECKFDSIIAHESCFPLKIDDIQDELPLLVQLLNSNGEIRISRCLTNKYFPMGDVGKKTIISPPENSMLKKVSELVNKNEDIKGFFVIHHPFRNRYGDYDILIKKGEESPRFFEKQGEITNRPEDSILLIDRHIYQIGIPDKMFGLPIYRGYRALEISVKK